mgnify:CR=1 FL=1
MTGPVKIAFLGGAGTVTGSKFLITTHSKKILVDCGLFQGIKEDRLLNWQPFPIDPRSIDAVLLTHAHLDHTGYLPLLTKNGFSGPIFCSFPTAHLTELILLDSAKIQMEDAGFENENHLSKHHPALPLYDTDDVRNLLAQIKPLNLDQWHPMFENEFEVRLSQSGHILGSTFVEFRVGKKVMVFSGDLGREHPLILNPRKNVPVADTLILESTYGDKTHSKQDPKQELEKIISRAFENQGSVLIPSFSIGRSQDILYLLNALKSEGKIPPCMKIYLDSPMAEKASQIFDRFPTWHTLDEQNVGSITQMYTPISSVTQSAKLCSSNTPSIILAGSGMLNGGRIRHHLVKRISDPKNEIVLVGYQAAGTPGRFLKEGTEELKLFGQYLPVKAKISEITSLSAHADQREIIHWLNAIQKKPQQVFLVHGEPQAQEGLRVRLTDEFHIPIIIPKRGYSFPALAEKKA